VLISYSYHIFIEFFPYNLTDGSDTAPLYLCFCRICLAVFGFEALLKNKSKKSIIVASLLGISTIVLSWGFVLLEAVWY
jgi:hypothetical protein